VENQCHKLHRLSLKSGWGSREVDLTSPPKVPKYGMVRLTPEEVAYVELKLTLSRSAKEYRRSRMLTQVEMAQLMKSGQSCVAKIETGDASLSLYLMICSLLAMAPRERIWLESLRPRADRPRAGLARGSAIKASHDD
jgi:DNA-binding XRE family transcriptional regulator